MQVVFKRTPLTTAIVVSVLATFVVTAFAWDSHSFTADFDNGMDELHLEDFDDAFSVVDGAVRKKASTGPNDRAYVRTVATNYDAGDWTYTIDFDIANDDEEIVFVGIGSGQDGRSYPQPTSSATFKIYNAEQYLEPAGIWGNGGKVELVITQEEGSTTYYAKVGTLTNNGLYTAQIRRVGADLYFEILDAADGSLLMERSVAVPAIIADPNASLFFGNSQTGTSYDNMRVQYDPYPVSEIALDATRAECKANWRNYQIFKNHGDCVSYVSTGKKNLPAN